MTHTVYVAHIDGLGDNDWQEVHFRPGDAWRSAVDFVNELWEDEDDPATAENIEEQIENAGGTIAVTSHEVLGYPDQAEPQLVSLVREIHEAVVGAHAEPLELGDHPATEYGARIFYADGTMEEIDNIDGVQIAKLSDGTFPFGFIQTGDGSPEDDANEYRAGYWDDEGIFTPFSDREQPRPGW